MLPLECFYTGCGITFKFVCIPETGQIQGHRYINDVFEAVYPLKKKAFKHIQVNSIDQISSLIKDGCEPTINSAGKIEWVKNESPSFSGPLHASSSESSREDLSASRLDIHQIIMEFLAGSYDRTAMEEKINKLPLDPARRQTLTNAIQILLKPQVYYRRLSLSRSGSTDPKILAILKKYINDETTPQDELEILKQLVANLLSGRSSSSRREGSDQPVSSPRINEAKTQFSGFIALREQRGTNTVELKQVEARLNELTENLDAFIQRKKEEIISILNSITTDGDDSDPSNYS